MRPDSIAIIGVGRLGSNLAQELIRSGAFSKLYLDNRSISRLESVALSLRVFASCVGSQTEIVTVRGKIPNDASIVVITIKESYDPRTLLEREQLPEGFERNVRTIGIRKDLPLVKAVCAKLNGYRGKIVVVTNPVDIFTCLVKGWIPTAEVYGFGVTVDAARLAFCAQQEGVKCTAADCVLGGVHIGRLVQLRSLWNQASPLYLKSELAVEDLLEDVSKIGPAIVRGLGFTLHDCATVFARDLTWLAAKDSTRKYLCVSIGNQSSAVARPLFYSEATGNYEIFNSLPDTELQQLDNAAQLVKKVVDMIRRTPIFRYKP
jgi:malate/lactate dehydrogenase